LMQPGPGFGAGRAWTPRVAWRGLALARLAWLGPKRGQGFVALTF